MSADRFQNAYKCGDIERRKALSYEQFAQQYLYPNNPVIVTDGIKDWKALSRWTPEFFRSEFGGVRFRMGEREKGQADYKLSDETEYTMESFIDSVLASTDDTPAPYLRNKILNEMFPTLIDDIQPLPEYFLPNWLPDRFLVSKVGSVLNRGAALEIYIGGKGGAFPVLHYDGAGTHAFLMQIYGRKKVILYEPFQEPYLYPSPTKPNLSLVDDIDHPNLVQFPLFAKAVRTNFVLEPGELLFIPSRWWHTTKMLSPSITVSANVVNQSNWHELVSYVGRRERNPFISFASRLYLGAAGAKRSWRDRQWKKRARLTSVRTEARR